MERNGLPAKIALENGLTHQNADVVDASAIALGYLNRRESKEAKKDCLEKLLKLTNSDHDSTRASAYLGIRLLGDSSAKRALLHLLKHGNRGDENAIILRLSELMDPSVVEPILAYQKDAHGKEINHPSDVPPALAFAITSGWIAKNLDCNAVRLIGRRFGYIDEFVNSTIDNDDKSEALEISRELLSKVGVATKNLFLMCRNLMGLDREALLDDWVQRITEYQRGLLGDEMFTDRVLGRVPSLAGALGSNIYIDLLFAALRSSDYCSVEAKLKGNPFNRKRQVEIPGTFFFRTFENFRDTYLARSISDCEAILDKYEVATETKELFLPYMIMSHAAVSSETREEESAEAEYLFQSRWNAAATLLEIEKGELIINPKYSEMIAKIEPNVETMPARALVIDSIQTSRAISKVIGTANRNIWKYAELDPLIIKATENMIKGVRANPMWEMLSSGSKACLKLYCYHLHSVDCAESVPREMIFGDVLHRIFNAEKIAKGVLPSIGIELQAVNVSSEELFLWKEVLSYFDIPSPRRPEFFYLLEAAFKPTWSAIAFEYGVPALMSLILKSENESSLALHVSIGGELGDEAKFIALLLSALSSDSSKYPRYGDQWRKGMTRIMSKGLIFKNYDSVSVSDDVPRPLLHTEIRTGKITSGGVTSKYSAAQHNTFLPGVQYLASSALAFLKSSGPSPLSPMEQRLAEIWSKFRSEMENIYCNPSYDGSELFHADWYEGTGDPRDVNLVDQLKILSIVERWNVWQERNMDKAQEIRARITVIFAKAANEIQLVINHPR